MHWCRVIGSDLVKALAKTILVDYKSEDQPAK